MCGHRSWGQSHTVSRGSGPSFFSKTHGFLVLTLHGSWATRWLASCKIFPRQCGCRLGQPDSNPEFLHLSWQRSCAGDKLLHNVSRTPTTWFAYFVHPHMSTADVAICHCPRGISPMSKNRWRGNPSPICFRQGLPSQLLLVLSSHVFSRLDEHHVQHRSPW